MFKPRVARFITHEDTRTLWRREIKRDAKRGVADKVNGILSGRIGRF